MPSGACALNAILVSANALFAGDGEHDVVGERVRLPPQDAPV